MPAAIHESLHLLDRRGCVDTIAIQINGAPL
jgi:hypothetical protein